ncbi:MAG: winged helix-turn-helix transcriptional regulator [Thermodesulfovibrionales bacterium]|nr:winged helix-turn-helix transcriptional regulator [Thermodesulfovibrionales bacterium]
MNIIKNLLSTYQYTVNGMQRKIIVDEAGVLLITLLKYGKLSLLELREKSELSNQTVYNNARRLKEMGLIQEELENEFPRRRLISLTEKGRKVAEKLEEIEGMLK